MGAAIDEMISGLTNLRTIHEPANPSDSGRAKRLRPLGHRFLPTEFPHPGPAVRHRRRTCPVVAGGLFRRHRHWPAVLRAPGGPLRPPRAAAGRSGAVHPGLAGLRVGAKPGMADRRALRTGPRRVCRHGDHPCGGARSVRSAGFGQGVLATGAGDGPGADPRASGGRAAVEYPGLAVDFPQPGDLCRVVPAGRAAVVAGDASAAPAAGAAERCLRPVSCAAG